MKVDLASEVALVTGAARGIGKSITNTLGENGADVISADIRFRTSRRNRIRGQLNIWWKLQTFTDGC